MGALSGIGVLITRPEHQAQPLCRLIEAEGGNAILYPALAIRARADRDALRGAIGDLNTFDLVVFTSANAVRFGAGLLGQRRTLRLAAIGPATAAALNAAGYRVALMPPAGADSESLLALPELAHMSGQRVLIVRGTGGRELLARVLAERGARISYAEVYVSEAAQPAPELQATVERLWQQGGVQVYTATSVVLLEALTRIVPLSCRQLMDRTALLTGTHRVADAAARLGLASPLILAEGMDDAALVGALRDSRLQGSLAAALR
ncbi:MAG: uroporphyrinogen-III synthase [Gammaproteobacteria bacterium]|nr:MAG: uroporphyrinogen-III synthase [Gammaproteobacteria bacterium]